MRSTGLLLGLLYLFPAGAFAQPREGTRWDSDTVRLAPDARLLEMAGVDGELALERAAAAWGGIPGVPAIRIVHASPNVIAWSYVWGRAEDETPETLGVTRRWSSGVVIEEAHVLVNGTKPISIGDELDPTAYDFESLMVHEFGHVLGIEHDASDGSVMHDGMERGQWMREPSEADVARVAALYAQPLPDRNYQPYPTLDAGCSSTGARGRLDLHNPMLMAACAIALAYFQRRRTRS